MTNREHAMNILHYKAVDRPPVDSKQENLNVYFEKVKELYA